MNDKKENKDFHREMCEEINNQRNTLMQIWDKNQLLIKRIEEIKKEMDELKKKHNIRINSI